MPIGCILLSLLDNPALETPEKSDSFEGKRVPSLKKSLRVPLRPLHHWSLSPRASKIPCPVKGDKKWLRCEQFNALKLPVQDNAVKMTELWTFSWILSVSIPSPSNFENVVSRTRGNWVMKFLQSARLYPLELWKMDASLGFVNFFKWPAVRKRLKSSDLEV